MSEEEEAQEEAQEEETEEETKEEPKGTEFVEFDDPKVEARFTQIYGHMKQNERVIEQMAGDNKKLMERLDKYERDSEDRGAASQMEVLKAQYQKSIEEGDAARATAVNEQMIDLKTRPQAAQTPVETVQPQVQLSPDQQMKLATWAQEIDTEGNWKRIFYSVY